MKTNLQPGIYKENFTRFSMSVPSGYNLIKTPRFSPEQISRLSTLLGVTGQSTPQAAGLLGQLALGQGQAYDTLEAPAYRSFQRAGADTAQRYATGGTLHSSGFQSAMAGAAESLAENLALQRSQIQDNALSRLLGLESSLLSSSPYDYQLEEKSPSFLSQIIGTGLKGLGGASLGFLTGGPLGAIAGGIAGSAPGIAGLFDSRGGRS